MSHRSYLRFRRYAVFSLLQLIGVVLVGVTGLESGYAAAVVLVVSLPVLWAWGAFQADVAINASFEDSDRRRWRVLLACLPGSMALYWHRHIRAILIERSRLGR